MRFQVPQFVDIEDKILGPLTIKMFAYYAVAGIILVPLWLLVDISLFITLALPVIGVAAAFAHVKWNGQKLIVLVLNGVKYYTGGTLYLWRREGKLKAIILQGEEYAQEIEFGALPASALNATAEALQTEGNISNQDAADPLVDETGSEGREDEKTQGHDNHG